MATYPVFRMVWINYSPAGLVLCNKRNAGAMNKVVSQCGFSSYREFVRTYPGKMKNQSKVFGRYLGRSDKDYLDREVPKTNSRYFYDLGDGDYDTLRSIQYSYMGTANPESPYYSPYYFFLYPTLEDASKDPHLRHFCIRDLWFCSDWNEEWLDSNDGQKSIWQLMYQRQT